MNALEPSAQTSAELLAEKDLVPALGVSVATVRRFLGKPDGTKPNPRYRFAGSHMRFYLSSRVEAVKSNAEFIASQQRSQAASERAKSGANTKRAKLAREVQAWVPATSFPRKLKQARFNAIRHYNDRNACKRALKGLEFDLLTPDADPLTLDRITVNYLRHRCTDYDYQLARYEGRPGVDYAVRAYKMKIHKLVAEAFPVLEKECLRQTSLEAAS